MVRHSCLVLHCCALSFTIFYCPTVYCLAQSCAVLAYLPFTVLHNPELYCAVLSYLPFTVLPFLALTLTVMYCLAQSCAVLRCPALSCAVLRCPALSCAVLRCPARSYAVLRCPAYMPFSVLHNPAPSCTVIANI
jgi:hypothetical protein